MTLRSLNSVDDVAEFVKVSPRTVFRAIAAGELHALRAGRQLRISEQAVWAWLERGAKRPAESNTERSSS